MNTNQLLNDGSFAVKTRLDHCQVCNAAFLPEVINNRNATRCPKHRRAAK